MIYERSTLAVAIFAVFVGITLGLSFYLGRRAKSASGYFAAGGGIHWFVSGIASIGFFYVLTLYIGLGAKTSGALDLTNSNMAAPLLAKSFGEWLFAIISAIALTTVLGTVSGLILFRPGTTKQGITASTTVGMISSLYFARPKVRCLTATPSACAPTPMALGLNN